MSGTLDENKPKKVEAVLSFKSYDTEYHELVLQSNAWATMPKATFESGYFDLMTFAHGKRYRVTVEELEG